MNEPLIQNDFHHQTKPSTLNKSTKLNGQLVAIESKKLSSTQNCCVNHQIAPPKSIDDKSLQLVDVNGTTTNCCSLDVGENNQQQLDQSLMPLDCCAITDNDLKICDSIWAESGSELATTSSAESDSQVRNRPNRIISANQRTIRKKFAHFDGRTLSSAPAPDVKIGQRVAYKEYYGNEFGTIRWIGRVPQISADWTVGVEFDNAIGEGDGSLHGRRYFIAKDCFAKFLALSNVALVDQHVGRPEPGTMISVMSAAVRPGQMISIQRVSTVHVQHCFLNAPHRKLGAEFLAVNTRLHCQCPNCGPCAHVVKPPRTQRLRDHKNATHMCQFSTYTCCGMESSEEALCTYTGNRISSMPPPAHFGACTASGQLDPNFNLPPVGNSWIEGSGYLANLQAEQRKLMPEEYRLGAAPEDFVGPQQERRRGNSSRTGRKQHQQDSFGYSDKQHHHRRRGRSRQRHEKAPDRPESPVYSNLNPSMEPEQEHIMQAKVDDEQYKEARQLALVSKEQCQDFPIQDQFQPDAFRQTDVVQPNKPTGFVYRDSIENRYLFPSDERPLNQDDAIDSTLEADLENLSQARYGTLRPPDRRSNSSGNARNLLVKSLRSLVSCLSASKTTSNANLAYGSHHSDETLRIVCRRPLSGQATPVNKCQPSFGRRRSFSCNSSPCSSSSTATLSSSSARSTSPDFPPPPAPDRLWSEPFTSCGVDSEAPTHLIHGGSTQIISRRIETREFFANQTATVESRPIDWGANHHATGKRQISSSSDCGFSSAASQNSLSVNLMPLSSGFGPPTKAALTRPVQCETRNEQIEAIFRRISARLIEPGKQLDQSISSEDLAKLRASLYELLATDTPPYGGGTNWNLEACYEQLIAKLLHKRHLEAPNKFIGDSSSCCQAASRPEASPNSPGHTDSSDDSGNNNNNNSSHQQQQQPNSDSCQPTGNETATSSSLPRAFELKLTLSINETSGSQAGQVLKIEQDAAASRTN